MTEKKTEVCEAFVRGEVAHGNNSVSTGTALFLHGTMIARKNARGEIEGTVANYPSRTTISHLNMLCNVAGVSQRFFTMHGYRYYGKRLGYFKPVADDQWVRL